MCACVCVHLFIIDEHLACKHFGRPPQPFVFVSLRIFLFCVLLLKSTHKCACRSNFEHASIANVLSYQCNYACLFAAVRLRSPVFRPLHRSHYCIKQQQRERTRQELRQVTQEACQFVRPTSTNEATKTNTRRCHDILNI